MDHDLTITPSPSGSAPAAGDCDLILVCGPSSCGKSTYIDRAVAGGRLPKGAAVCLGQEYAKMAALPRPLVMHYNTLRPIDQEWCKEQAGQANRYGALLRRIDFKIDPAWRAVLEYPGKKRAVVLLTREETLWRRVAGRQWNEPGRADSQPYLNQRWLSHCRRIDLAAHYRQFVEELRCERIPCEILAAESDDYPAVDGSDDFALGVNRDLSQLGCDDLRQLIAEPIFEYQKIRLPFGLETPGQDRSDTLPSILPASLAGKSVLDVGCALGFFCFEAETRGATTIVGLERKERRFEAATLLGRIRSSRTEFRFMDVQEEKLDEHFDVVLLLNVIHHLRQPFQVLRDLAGITRELLAIEFPGLSDVRFRQTAPGMPSDLDDYPLIGVSSLGRVDQTFVYSPMAIRRFFAEQVGAAWKVEITPSPMANRFIARCYR